jgi:hypothetical protein
VLPLALIFSVATAVTAGRPISDPALGPSAYPQSLSTIASNGSGFLAVWRTESFGGGLHIDGVLLDCDGHRISPAAFRLVSFTDARSIQLMPFDDHYVMAWTDTVPALHLVEVSATGKVIRTIITRGIPLYGFQRIAWNGEHFLQAEAPPPVDQNGRIIVTTFDRNGNMLSSEVALDKMIISSAGVTVAAKDFVLVTTSTEGVAVRKISSEGHVVSKIIVDAQQHVTVPALTSNGSDVVVAWQNSGLGVTFSIQTALVTSDGHVIVHSPLGVAENTSLYPQILVRSDAKFGLVLNSFDTPTQKRSAPTVVELDREGLPLGSPVPIIASGESRVATAAATCSGTMYVLSTDSTYSGAILGMSFSIPQNQPVSSELITVAPTRQSNPVIASDGVNSLAIWIDQTAERESLRGRVVSRDGSPITDEVELTRIQGFLGPPAIAYGNGEYLIVWQNGNQLLARRVTSNAVLLEDAPFVVAGGVTFGEPVIAWNGSQFLVAWVKGKIFGALVSPQANVSFIGQLSNDPAPPPNWSFSDGSPSLAWDAEQFVLAWTFSRAPVCVYALLGCTYLSDIRAIRLDRFAHAVDAQSTLVSEDGQRASLTSNGRNMLAAIDDESGTHAALIDARKSSLSVGSPIAVFDAWTSPRSNVVWDGSMYEVIWRTAMPDGWHLGMVPISEDGFRGQPMGTMTDRSETTTPPAASSSGLIVIPEIQNADVNAASARTVAHRASEMTALPRPPAPPLAVDAVHSSPYVVVVAWKGQSDGEEGFVIEQKTWPGSYYVYSTVPANTEQATVALGGPGVFRIRAWNAGGMSAPSAEMTMHSPPRKRSVATK